MKTRSEILGNNNLLVKIKSLVRTQEPDATLILYGSFVRGDNRPDSDIDLIILVSKNNVTMADERRIKYPLYDLEFDTGQLISPLVFSKQDWEQTHKVTPFYENVKREGITL